MFKYLLPIIILFITTPAFALSLLSNTTIPSLTAKEERLYTITVLKDTPALTINTSASTGDIDIYLSKDTAKYFKEATWKSITDTSTEKISLIKPAVGTYYLTVRSFTPSTNVKLGYTLTNTTPAVPTTPVLGKNTPVTNSLSAKQEKLYTFTVPATTTNLTITTTGLAGDADLYLTKDVPLPFKSATWKSILDGSNEKITLAKPTAGRYYLILRAFTPTINTVLTLSYTSPNTTSTATTTKKRRGGGGGGGGGSSSSPSTPAAVNGSCGTSNGQTLSSIPSTNLCTLGTASSVTDSTSYTWTCAGSNGGTTASCSASKTVLDTTRPTITNVSSNKSNGTYDTGEVIDIDLTASEAISGTAIVTLETGTTDRTCNAIFTSGTTATCNYTIQFGDSSSDLTVSTISGTLTDAALNTMTNFVPATNLAANKALVVSGVSGGGLGTADITLPTMTASNVTSRLSGVAPLAVFFDAQDTTSGLTSLPFHELLYQWDFNDEVVGGAGTCTLGAPVAREAGQGSYCTGVVTGNSDLDSKNYAEGPVAAHVFETPGTYTVTLTASQGDSDFDGTLEASEYKRGTVTVTVSDPDTIFTSDTVCIANGVTPTAGSNGCPTGSYGVDSSNASAINTALTTGCGGSGCKRVLLRRGDTFTLSSTIIITAAGPGMIGSYGSGAKPTISSNGVTQFTYRASDWRFVDIRQDLQGTNNSAVGVFSDTVDLTNVLLLRVDTFRGQGFKTAGSNLGSATSGIWDGIFLVDGTLKEPPTTPANGLNGYYPTGFRVAVMGNHIDMDQGSEHGSRSYAQRIVISHNTVEDIASGRAAITNRSFGWSGDGGIPAGTHSGTAVLAQNYDVGNGPGGTIGYGTTNQSIDGRPQHVIFERNISPRGIDTTALQYGTWRNNIIANSTTAGMGLASAQGMDTGIGQCPNYLYFYHNSGYSGATGSNSADIAQFVQLPPECTGLEATIQNNLIYAPDSTTDGVIMDLGGQVSETTCATCNTGGTGEKHTSPLYQANPAILISHFTPSSGSYANGRGIVVPVWNDFYGAWQPATRDIGAVVH